MVHRVIAVISTVCLVMLPSCNLKTSSAQRIPEIADSPSSQAVAAVKESMVSENNPYRELYREWDFWLVDHASVLSVGPSHGAVGQREPGEEVVYSIVDENGFLVPHLEFWKRHEDFRSLHRDIDSFGKDERWIYATGSMSDDIRAAKHDAWHNLMATYYPPIPIWLTSKKFLDATVLPDGKGVVLTVELQGSGLDQDHTASHAGEHEGANSTAAPAHSSGSWGLELYSPSGTLLAKADDYSWAKLFGWELPRSPKDPAWKESYAYWDISNLTDDRYYILENTRSDKVVAVYDYDGTKLDTLDPPRRDPHHFTAFSMKQVEDLIQRQSH